MAARKRIGDVYELVDGELIALVQYIGKDSTVAGSDVVEVISPVPSDWMSSFPSLPRLFRAHVFLKAGETLKLWRRAGHQEVNEHAPQRWCTVPPQDLGRDASSHWRVWTTGHPMAPASRDADIEEAEFGYVMSPIQIAHRVRHGRYTHDLPRKLET